MTVLTVFVLYMLLFIISWLATPDPQTALTNKSVDQAITKAEIVRDIILVVLGSNENVHSKDILCLGHMGVILQLICHMPFIFYIGKEHVLQAVDEHYYNSLSLMIDRIKNDRAGDPRFFLAEKKYTFRKDSILTDESNDLGGPVPAVRKSSVPMSPMKTCSFLNTTGKLEK